MPHATVGVNLLLLMGAVKLVITGLGAIITYYAFKAYRRTGDRSLGLLAGGFAMITVGAIVAGMSFELIGVPLAAGVIIDGAFVIVGFFLIANSLRVR